MPTTNNADTTATNSPQIARIAQHMGIDIESLIEDGDMVIGLVARTAMQSFDPEGVKALQTAIQGQLIELEDMHHSIGSEEYVLALWGELLAAQEMMMSPDASETTLTDEGGTVAPQEEEGTEPQMPTVKDGGSGNADQSIDPTFQ